MSKLFQPKIAKPADVIPKEIDYVQSRGATGRTILGGMLKTDEAKTKKQSILGG